MRECKRISLSNEVELYRGDCLRALKNVADKSVEAVVVDPPFGINYRSAYGQKIRNDLRPFIWWLYDSYRVAKPGGRLVCFTAWKYQEVFRIAIETAGWQIRSQVIWDKEIHGAGNCRQDFGPRHEVIWYATKGRYEFANGRPVSVLTNRYLFGHERNHPNEKPVELIERILKFVTSPGETVLDCCMGVGTTGVASVLNGRKFVGMELDPDYFAIARQRIAQALRG
jgi:DNA modification methylase